MLKLTMHKCKPGIKWDVFSHKNLKSASSSNLFASKDNKTTWSWVKVNFSKIQQDVK